MARAGANHQQAVRLDTARSHRELAAVLELQGRTSEAMESYRRALALEPRSAQTIHRLANLLSEQGALEEAVQLYEKVLDLTPESAEAHYDLGRARKRRGELNAAVECYRRAIALRPNCFEFHLNLAAVLFLLGSLPESADSYRRALTLKPDDPDAIYSLGVVLQEMGDAQGAAQCYMRTLQLEPHHADALCNLGAACTTLGDFQSAAAVLQRSLALRPGSPNAHCNLGNVHLKQGRTLAALASLKSALALDPNHPMALSSLGYTLETLDDASSAAQCYRRALQAHPDFAQARFYLGTYSLAEGDFAAGWRDYEARWGTADFRAARRRFAQPQWTGQDIRGSRVFIHAEQGLGDTMQFVRYLPMVAARGAEVVLEVHPNLYRLLMDSFGASALVIQKGEELPPFDWQCPLLSLPLAFGTSLTNIPARIPYLRAEEAAAQAWSERLCGNTLRVGLAWAGNPKHSRERLRSITLSQLEALLHTEGVKFYALQKGPAVEQLKTVPTECSPVDLDSQQRDFADTAAIVANLDLVISIDTSVAHLAGAMGKPVWILLHHMADWRWLRNRDNSPWYPTARLFRQTSAGDWSGVVKRLQENLLQLLLARGRKEA